MNIPDFSAKSVIPVWSKTSVLPYLVKIGCTATAWRATVAFTASHRLQKANAASCVHVGDEIDTIVEVKFGLLGEPVVLLVCHEAVEQVNEERVEEYYYRYYGGNPTDIKAENQAKNDVK